MLYATPEFAAGKLAQNGTNFALTLWPTRWRMDSKGSCSIPSGLRSLEGGRGEDCFHRAIARLRRGSEARRTAVRACWIQSLDCMSFAAFSQARGWRRLPFNICFFL